MKNTRCNEQSFENVVFGFPDTKQIPKSVNGCHLHYTGQGVTGITKPPSISLLPSCVTGSSRHLRLSCFSLIPYHQCLDQFSSLCQILPLSWATQLWLTHPTTDLLRTALFSCLMTSSTPPQGPNLTTTPQTLQPKIINSNTSLPGPSSYAANSFTLLGHHQYLQLLESSTSNHHLRLFHCPSWEPLSC